MIPLSESIKYAVAPLKVSANDKNQSIESVSYTHLRAHETVLAIMVKV